MVSKNKASNSRSSSAGSKKDKHGTNKNGKKGDGPSGSSFFMWFMIIALLGVWSSVAVVWFDLVDYEEVLGKLGIYDADGDGDFDVEDAKILLGMKEVERSVRAGKNEEPVQTSDNPPLKTETQTEEPKPVKASMAQESFKTNIEEPEPVEEELEPEPVEEEPEPVEEEPEPEPVEEEPEAEETNEFDAESEDSFRSEAEESVYVEDEAISETEKTMDEAVFEPEEVVSEQDTIAYESETEDFSDHLDSEGEREEDLPIGDEFIEDNDPEPEDKMDEFHAEEVEYVPGTDDIQEALPVQNSDEDYLSDAVPLHEAVEESVVKEADTPEAPKEHLAEEEHVNYSEDRQEVRESLESDHQEITGESKEETIIDEPDL